VVSGAQVEVPAPGLRKPGHCPCHDVSIAWRRALSQCGPEAGRWPIKTRSVRITGPIRYADPECRPEPALRMATGDPERTVSQPGVPAQPARR
jgi:hypothetical protein